MGTCGCALPQSELLITFGCPNICTMAGAFSPYDDAVAALSCNEMNRSELQRSSVWMAWISQLEKYGNASGDPSHPTLVFAERMIKEGCNVFRDGLQNCDWKGLGLPFKSIASLCPRTCLCDSLEDRASHCPLPQKCWQGCTAQDGQACVFPLKYHRLWYTRCTYKGFTRPWCATKV